jgi:C4-dicarboxylate-specific signal transduction histidine kinase
MRFFRELSIHTKLSLSALLAAGMALLIASILLIANDVAIIRKARIDQLAAIAKILGANCRDALANDQPNAAKEVLASLHLQRSVQFACVFTNKGRILARYEIGRLERFSPPLPRPTGYEISPDGFLDVSQAVFQDGELIGTVYLRASPIDTSAPILKSGAIVTVVMLGAMVMVFLFSSRLLRRISRPIIELAQMAQTISLKRDYSIRIKKTSSDEIGALYDDFNNMLDQIQVNERELQHAHDLLEVRVQERTRELSYTNLQLSNEIGERKRAEAELDAVQQQFVDAARKAGMAEVATGVLHNVGNILNSINVSATLVADRLKNSKLSELSRAITLMTEHAEDLGTYITLDERGKRVPGFLRLVATHLEHDHAAVLDEIYSLTKNVDHVKTIIAMQQSYAGTGGLVESVLLAELVDDAIRLNAALLEKYHIKVNCEYATLPEIRTERQKVLQILMNLVANAKDALIESDSEERRMDVRIRLDSEELPSRVLIEVQDTGIGIPAENLRRIFAHGFTTKRHGHGFGLHSSANAAKELGGVLRATSDGPGCGALFTVELPFKPVKVLT